MDVYLISGEKQDVGPEIGFKLDITPTSFG
jgi:hypothetical protein